MPTPQELLQKVQGALPKLPSPAQLLSTAKAQNPAPSFGENLFNTAKNVAKTVAKKVASTIDTFVPKAAQDIQDVFTGKLKVTPKDVLQGIATVDQGLVRGVHAFSQAFNEGVARIGKSVATEVIGPENTKKLSDTFGLHELSRDITGRDKITTYQEIYAKAKDYGLNNNATLEQADAFAGVAVFGMMFADNPAMGPGKAGVKLTAETVEKIASTGSEPIIKALVKAENAHLTDNELDFIVPMFRDAETPDEVRAATDLIHKASEIPAKEATEEIPEPRDILTKIKDDDIIPTVEREEAAQLDWEDAFAEPYQKLNEEAAVIQYQMRTMRASEKVEMQAKLDALNAQSAVMEQEFTKKWRVDSRAPARHVAPESAEEIADAYRKEVVEPLLAEGKGVSIGGDDMKHYFGGDFDPLRSNEYAKASYLLVNKLLDEVPDLPFGMLGGGPGSGKTELIAKTLLADGKFDGILYDTTLTNLEGATKLIEKARGQGRQIKLMGILSDLDKSRSFTIQRARATKRGVPDDVFANRHAAFPETLRGLLDRGIVSADEVHLFDFRDTNLTKEQAIEMVRAGKRVQNPVEVLSNVRYNEAELKQKYAESNYTKEGIRLRQGAVEPANGGGGRGSPDRDRADSGRRVAKPKPRGETTVRGEPFKADANVVRAISRAERPGEVSDILEHEYPHLSPGARSALSYRLARMHRSADINGMLNAIGNVESAVKRGRFAERALARNETAGLLRSVGDVLSESQRAGYLQQVSRAIKDREDAVLAQQEYDILWAEADQQVINRLNEATIMRDMLRDDVLAEHRGASLNKLYKGTFLSPKEVSLAELMEQKKGKGLDSRVDEIMGTIGGDSNDAQKALEEFLSIRSQMRALEKEMKELRPRARTARILQDMVEDVPIIAQERAGVIDSYTSPEAIQKYKDISGFSGQTRDVYRNFERVFLDRYDEVKKSILDPFDKSKGEMVDEVTKLGDRLELHIVKKLGIKRGSKESRAVQLYGEGKMSETELTETFKGASSKIIEATSWFRGEYERLLKEVNKVRAEIFPNDPDKLIPYRKDYFRHFQEMGGDFRGIVNMFDTPAGINPELAGLSEFTKPKSKFLSFAQERIGDETAIDAVGGFIDYAPAFAYAKHIDPHIGVFRYLRRRLSEVAPTPGTKANVGEEVFAKADALGEQEVIGKGTKLVKQEGLNNFIEFLDDFANDLAGKTNPMDRYLQKLGGRKLFKVVDWINSRVKANVILGNMSSAVAQIFNVPQGIASAKTYSVPGVQRMLASLFVHNEPMAASSFIKERYRERLQDRFNVAWVEHPVQATTEHAKEMASWITGALDEVGTKFIWNAHYAKGVAEMVEDPIKYADDITRKLVAGRGIGEVPLAQKSRIFQVLAPFQLEVANSWRVLGDFVRAKDFGAIAIFFVASYLMNRVAEDVRGSPVVFDPIEAMIDGTTQFADEMENDGNAGRASFKFFGRQVGELISNFPMGQTFASAFTDGQIEYISRGQIKDKRELYGKGDPARFGSGLLLFTSWNDPLYRLIPPFGGAQAKKSLEGILSVMQGEVRSADGKLMFTQEQNLRSILQAFMWGKNQTDEAQKAFAERDGLFTRTNRQDAQRTEEGFEAEKIWSEVKKLRDSGQLEKAAARMQEIETNNPGLAEKVADIAEDEANELNSSDRLVKMLVVENGERAKYITEQIKNLKSLEEKAEYLQTLDDKGLISDQVAEQIAVLLQPLAPTPSPVTADTSTRESFVDDDLGVDTTDIQGMVKAILDDVPFKDSVRLGLTDVKFGSQSRDKKNDVLTGNSTAAGEYRAAGTDFANFIAKLPLLSDEAKKFIIQKTPLVEKFDKTNITFDATHPGVRGILAHEILHHLFENSPMGPTYVRGETSPNENNAFFGGKFEDDWTEEKNNGNTKLMKIDKHIADHYDVDSMSDSSYFTERFAYLGEMVAETGNVNVIPKSLEKYYRDIFDFK